MINSHFCGHSSHPLSLINSHYCDHSPDSLSERNSHFCGHSCSYSSMLGSCSSGQYIDHMQACSKISADISNFMVLASCLSDQYIGQRNAGCFSGITFLRNFLEVSPVSGFSGKTEVSPDFWRFLRNIGKK